MHNRTIKLWEPQVAPTVAAALYTCPTNVRCRIAKVTATVTGTAARALTAYLVPSGGSAGATNTIEQEYSIAGKQRVTLDGLIGHVLEAGDSIQIIVDAGTDCTLHATGTEVTS